MSLQWQLPYRRKLTIFIVYGPNKSDNQAIDEVFWLDLQDQIDKWKN